MKFISESPESKYPTVTYDGILIFLDENDLIKDLILTEPKVIKDS